MRVNPKRIRRLDKGHGKEIRPGRGPVAYWMSRDQRVSDNWALLYALQLAEADNRKVVVVFCLFDKYPGANLRHFSFMLQGLREIKEDLQKKNIPFFLLRGDPVQEVSSFAEKNRISALVTDFDPLRIKRRWRSRTAETAGTPFFEVDTHNIVPCLEASPRQEFAAHTIRPKINRLLPQFMEDFPPVRKNRDPSGLHQGNIDTDSILKGLDTDRSVGPARGISPGTKEAFRVLGAFLQGRIEGYGSRRNNPANDIQSGLSPYLHFGNISAQRAAMEVMACDAAKEDKDAFLEQLIIRRELSDNYCWYNSRYDTPEGFPDWARKTLDKHRHDPRDHIYSLESLENSDTHDELWNAAQSQMAATGKMHGYMRMYWAKKILEWTASPEQAHETAVYMNDRYSLDGRDPNGYTGISWSIGGLHDRAWGERPVFGKVRYMSRSGAKRKFDAGRYIDSISGAG